MNRFLFAVFLTGIVMFVLEFYGNFLSQSINKIRLVFLKNGGQSCIAELKNYTNDFKILGTFKNGQCRVVNAVSINSYKGTKLSGKLTLSCPTAVNIGKYFREIKAENITHMGSYNCRTIARSKVYSEHSYGTAIDIATINGAILEKDWNKKSDKGQILNNAYRVACKYFSNVLTPDTNQAHKNHFHFDNGFGPSCYLKWMIK